MREQIHIATYDSIPTDLAAEMRTWPEFLSGEGYVVKLRDEKTSDDVSVWMSDDPADFPTVIVEGRPRTSLFDKVVGRVIQALAEHSDDLRVCRRTAR